MERRQACLQLPPHAADHTAGELAVLARHEHDNLAGALAPVEVDRLAAGTQLDRADEARPLDGARAALGDGQDARRPVALLGLLRARRARRSRCRPPSRSAPSSVARATMFSRSVSLRETRSSSRSRTAASLARSGPRARSSSRREDRSHDADEVGRVRLAAVAVVQPADDCAGDRQVQPLAARLARQHRALVLGRGAGDREHAARGVDHRDAGVERAPAGARDLGQSGAALDGLGDGSERGAEGGVSACCRLLGHAGIVGPSARPATRPTGRTSR